MSGISDGGHDGDMQRGSEPRDQWAMAVLGRWLLAWRRSTGATQRCVAHLAGIDQAHLCRIEQGKRRPSGVPLARLLVALDWLSGGGDRRGPWASVGTAPNEAARWGLARPPAVLGREPAQASSPSGDERLNALLGLGPEEGLSG